MLHARQQLGEVQVARLHAVDGTERTAEYVVEALEGARALYGQDVRRLLDHAQHAWVSAPVRADHAQLAFGEVEALAAEADLLLDLDDSLRQRQDVLGPLAQYVVGETLRRPRAYAGQLGKLVDKARDRRCVHSISRVLYTGLRARTKAAVVQQATRRGCSSTQRGSHARGRVSPL